MKVFVKSSLRQGMILHVKSSSLLGKYIRICLDQWVKRLCREYNLEYRQVFGCHDGLFIQRGSSWFIGESLASRGTVATPLEDYERDINLNVTQVRVYEVIDATSEEGDLAAQIWDMSVKGTPYDFPAFFRLLFKSLFADWSDSRIKWMRKLGQKAAGYKWANWCTEGVARSWRTKNIFQTANPTPMTTEQVAGELPRKPGKKITLRNITEEVLKEV